MGFHVNLGECRLHKLWGVVRLWCRISWLKGGGFQQEKLFFLAGSGGSSTTWLWAYGGYPMNDDHIL